MKPISVGILSAAAVAGLAGSTVAYAWASSGVDTPAAVSSTRPAGQSHPHAQPVRQGTHFRWAPCVAPAHLENGVCVTDVVHTVVVPAPAAPAAPAAPYAAARQATQPAAQGGASTGPAGEPGEEHADEPGEDHEEHGDDDGDHAEEQDD
jgi:hypothetical protein